MATRGHNVTIAALSPQCDYAMPPGVHYLLIEDRYRGPLRRQTEIRRRAKQLDQALCRHFANKNIDLAISNLPKADRITVRSQRLKDAWLCLHCAIAVGQLGNKTGFARWRKQRQLVKTYSGRKLITVSRALQADILACGIKPVRMETIYNPFDFEAIQRQSQQACSMDGQRFLLHVGRFDPQKRHDRLLQAFKASGYPGKLVLLGQGSDAAKAAIEQQARQLALTAQVIFAGFSDNPYSWMRAAELLLLSSDYEGLGNVLIESLICGTPVVSTRCPVGPEEILTGDLARGLSDLQPASLAMAIQQILAQRPVIDLAHLQQFALASVVDQYLSLITS